MPEKKGLFSRTNGPFAFTDLISNEYLTTIAQKQTKVARRFSSPIGRWRAVARDNYNFRCNYAGTSGENAEDKVSRLRQNLILAEWLISARPLQIALDQMLINRNDKQYIKSNENPNPTRLSLGFAGYALRRTVHAGASFVLSTWESIVRIPFAPVDTFVRPFADLKFAHDNGTIGGFRYGLGIALQVARIFTAGTIGVLVPTKHKIYSGKVKASVKSNKDEQDKLKEAQVLNKECQKLLANPEIQKVLLAMGVNNIPNILAGLRLAPQGDKIIYQNIKDASLTNLKQLEAYLGAIQQCLDPNNAANNIVTTFLANEAGRKQIRVASIELENSEYLEAKGKLEKEKASLEQNVALPASTNEDEETKEAQPLDNSKREEEIEEELDQLRIEHEAKTASIFKTYTDGVKPFLTSLNNSIDRISATAIAEATETKKEKGPLIRAGLLLGKSKLMDDDAVQIRMECETTSDLRDYMEEDIEAAFAAFNSSAEPYAIKSTTLLKTLAYLRTAYDLKATQFSPEDPTPEGKIKKDSDKIALIQQTAFDKVVDAKRRIHPNTEVMFFGGSGSLYQAQFKSSVTTNTRNEWFTSKNNEDFNPDDVDYLKLAVNIALTKAFTPEEGKPMPDEAALDKLRDELYKKLNSNGQTGVEEFTDIFNNAKQGAYERAAAMLVARKKREPINDRQIAAAKEAIDLNARELIQPSDKKGKPLSAAELAKAKETSAIAFSKQMAKNMLVLDCRDYIGRLMDLYRDNRLTTPELIQNLGRLQQIYYNQALLAHGNVQMAENLFSPQRFAALIYNVNKEANERTKNELGLELWFNERHPLFAVLDKDNPNSVFAEYINLIQEKGLKEADYLLVGDNLKPSPEGIRNPLLYGIPEGIRKADYAKDQELSAKITTAKCEFGDDKYKEIIGKPAKDRTGQELTMFWGRCSPGHLAKTREKDFPTYQGIQQRRTSLTSSSRSSKVDVNKEMGIKVNPDLDYSNPNSTNSSAASSPTLQSQTLSSSSSTSSSASNKSSASASSTMSGTGVVAGPGAAAGAVKKNTMVKHTVELNSNMDLVLSKGKNPTPLKTLEDFEQTNSEHLHFYYEDYNKVRKIIDDTQAIITAFDTEYDGKSPSFRYFRQHVAPTSDLIQPPASSPNTKMIVDVDQTYTIQQINTLKAQVAEYRKASKNLLKANMNAIINYALINYANDKNPDRIAQINLLKAALNNELTGDAKLACILAVISMIKEESMLNTQFYNASKLCSYLQDGLLEYANVHYMYVNTVEMMKNVDIQKVTSIAEKALPNTGNDSKQNAANEKVLKILTKQLGEKDKVRIESELKDVDTKIKAAISLAKKQLNANQGDATLIAQIHALEFALNNLNNGDKKDMLHHKKAIVAAVIAVGKEDGEAKKEAQKAFNGLKTLVKDTAVVKAVPKPDAAHKDLPKLTEKIGNHIENAATGFFDKVRGKEKDPKVAEKTQQITKHITDHHHVKH